MDGVTGAHQLAIKDRKEAWRNRWRVSELQQMGKMEHHKGKDEEGTLIRD